MCEEMSRRQWYAESTIQGRGLGYRYRVRVTVFGISEAILIPTGIKQVLESIKPLSAAGPLHMLSLLLRLFLPR